MTATVSGDVELESLYGEIIFLNAYRLPDDLDGEDEDSIRFLKGVTGRNEVVDTGDRTDLGLWLLLMLVAVGIMVWQIRSCRRVRR